MKQDFPGHTTEQLEVSARTNHEMARELFSRHRAGHDMRDVLHEARLLKAEAQMMRKEIRRRRSEAKKSTHQEKNNG